MNYYYYYYYYYHYFYCYYYRYRINKHSSRCRQYYESSDTAPLISKLTQRYPAAANENECLFIRPIALTSAMSVNIDIRGEGVRPTLKTSRMSVYLSDTGIIAIVIDLTTPSPPTESLDFRSFDSSKLLIIKGGNSRVRIIL